MESGRTVEIGGQYCCLYHLKNKIKLKKGSIFPSCNFAGLRCEGKWYLLKAIKEKTPEEIYEANNHRRRQSSKNRYRRAKPIVKLNKWDFEKW